MASEKKFEPLFSVPCGLQPALSSGDIGSELRELFEQEAKELNARIEAMEIMPDHVHLSVLASPAITPQLIVNQMKGYTSHVLRERHDWLRSRLPTLWTRSY